MDAMNMYGGAAQTASQVYNGYGQPVQNYPQMTNQDYYQIPAQNVIQNTQNQFVSSQQTYQTPNQMPDNTNKKIAHPTEFWSRETSEMVCFIEDNLSQPANNEYMGSGGNELLMTLHSKFSKFKINLFKMKEKKFLSYNINPSVVSGLEKKLDAINMVDMFSRTSDVKNESREESLSPAYTVSISTGKFKGETPASLILNAAPENLQQIFNDLNQQRNFLLQNIQKYPKNQIQVDAISQAFALYNEGKLIKTNAVNPNKTVIFKDFKIPNAKNVDEQGYTKVTAFEIYYTKGENYPISIEIVNAKAIPKTHQNGTITASMSNAKDVDKACFNMTLFDFSDMIHEMKQQKKVFEDSIRNERRQIGISEYKKQLFAN